MRTFTDKAALKRLLASLGGGFVFALMWGPQEGTNTGDFGIAFFQAMGLRKSHSMSWHFPWRLLIFLALGVAVFLIVSTWRYVAPFVRSPGSLPLLLGFITILLSQTAMNWDDPLPTLVQGTPNPRFGSIHKVVAQTPQLSGLTNDFFQWWLCWLGPVVILVLCLAAIMRPALRKLGFVVAVLAVALGLLAYKAHHDLVKVGGAIDHSLGVYADMIGYLILACAGLIVALSTLEKADPRGFLLRISNWRPGMPIAAISLVFGLFAYLNDCWYGPLTHDADFAKTQSLFKGTRVSSLATQYLSWLGWTLFLASVVLAVASCYLAHRIIAWLSVVVGIAGITITFLTLHSMTFTAFKIAPNDGQTWANIGVGGFMALLVFALNASASAQVLFNTRESRASVKTWSHNLPVTSMVNKARESAQGKTFILVLLAFAVFYPPMLNVVWQNVVVTQIGVYVLLAIGLNVVVGWAGLLDLGYIAFYAIGSYTTAYFTNSLPRKPPSWLHLSPLMTIPFAIITCLIAGVLLGAPTLRLRGDYLAIVTLGFGEIITIVATNNPFNFTGGSIGPTVPPPRIHLLGLKVVFGEDNLPFWYLLLVLIIIVLILFYRLEGSRLGRAWAAIREDEVAAQATGVNTTRVKLLAFAIGASTSGVAGVFFATQVGYFDPSIFTLQASILIVAYVVFGGMGSLYGAMAGAAVLTWLPQFLKPIVPLEDRQMWVGAALLAMMIFRPAGLLPAKRRKAELEGLDAPSSAETVAVPASEGL